MRPTRLLSALPLLAALSVAGCDTAQAPPSDTPRGEVPNPELPTIAPGPARATAIGLAKARTRWAASGIRHYRMKVSPSCFCFGIVPVEVEFRNDSLVAWTQLPFEGGEPLPDSLAARNIYSVDSLFRVIGRALERTDAITTEFDTAYGYPRSVLIDYIPEAIDDEWRVSVTDFQRLD